MEKFHHRVLKVVNNCEKSYQELVPLKNEVSTRQMHPRAYTMDVFNSLHNNIIRMALILYSYGLILHDYKFFHINRLCAPRPTLDH